MAPSVVRVRIGGWLDKEELLRLLEFSRYGGRDSDGLTIYIDPAKARSSGYTWNDIAAILRGINGVDEADLARIEDLAREERRVVIELDDSGNLWVSSKTYLKPILEGSGIGVVYDRSRRAYRAKPHAYWDLVRLFESKGLIVDDRVFVKSSSRVAGGLEFTGVLRDYQSEALEKWRGNGYRGVVSLPTGAGKTVLGIAGIAELGVWSLVVVYTREQVKQWIEAVKRFLRPGDVVGAYYGEEKRLAPITITTYQTAYRRMASLARLFRLVVFDEAHHLPADKFKAIALGMPAPYRLGLSATIEREDGKHEEIFPLIGGVVYHITPGELTRRGYLAPFIIRRIRVDLLGEERRRYEELRKRFQALARGRTFDRLLEDASKGDKSAVEALRIHADMRSLIHNSRAKIDKVIDIARSELSRGSKIIIFTQYKRQAEEIASRLGALLLHGDVPKQFRDEALRRFKEEERGVLVVTTVGDEGIDIPDANVGIIVSGTGSRRQFVQRLGRLLRPSGGKTAILYEVIASRTSEEYQSRRRARI